MEFGNFADDSIVIDKFDTIVFEKVYEGDIFRGDSGDIRYRILERKDRSYFFIRETASWGKDDWTLKEASKQFSTYKDAKMHLGYVALGYDACSNWLERRKLHWFNFKKNYKEIFKEKFKKVGGITGAIIILVFYFIYVFIGFKFIKGGLTALGIVEEHFLYDFSIIVLGWILLLFPIVFSIKKKWI